MSGFEKMSHVDTAWLRMDRPANLMQILGVMLFDGQVDFDHLLQTVEKRLLAYDRFRQVPRRHGTGYAWMEDRHFDVHHHVRRAVLPGSAGKQDLQQFCADLSSTPLNPSRPLWDVHLADTSLGGSALIMRVHHCIGDGIALVRVIMSIFDDSLPLPASKKPRDEPVHHADDDLFWHMVWRPITDGLLASMQVSGLVWSKVLEVFNNPDLAQTYSRIGTGLGLELGKLLLMPHDSPTRFKGRPETAKCVAWSDPISLPDVKSVGRVLGCSVNDLLLASVAGALRSYLVAHGDDTEDVNVRAMVPVNLRRSKDIGKLGNKFGIVTLDLPVGIENPLARLYETRARMQSMKQSWQPALTLLVMESVGRAPRLAQEPILNLLSNKATAVMTNVPGPTQALYLGQARLRQPLFWVPQSGNIGMGVSILSYNNQVQFGLITDKSMVPDPERIVERFAIEFEKLLMLVLMEPWDRLHDPEAVAAQLQPAAA